MSDLRKAAEMALEYLKAHKPKISEGSLPVLLHDEIIATIKEALAQRTWVGLTDGEVKDTWGQANHHGFYGIETFELFAHNIEAKLKEKNT